MLVNIFQQQKVFFFQRLKRFKVRKILVLMKYTVCGLQSQGGVMP